MECAVRDIKKILESKERYRQRLALLSVPEKVRIIVELQERRAPILRMQGRKQIVWRLDKPSVNPDDEAGSS
jgi:hypothetical protein